MKHVFIIGSKGIPARYGGFETFVEELTARKRDSQIQYHVACAVDSTPDSREFVYNGAHCFRIRWLPIGPARAVMYDVQALLWSISYARKHEYVDPIFYVLACRIGPLASTMRRLIQRAGGRFLVNPDGHEWLRAKWSRPVRRYWKGSEKEMVANAHLVVCDSRNIEAYILDEYSAAAPTTVFIPYGASVERSGIKDEDPEFSAWLRAKHLCSENYYLIVGRFVPENNFETVIREFMRSRTEKRLAIITGVETTLLKELEERTGFRADTRITFVGTLYDQRLLKKVRESAYGYIHGHEVGGTNPSLLEALASTQLNLLLDVGFNREVAAESALYWSKDEGSLASVLEEAERLSQEERLALGRTAVETIRSRYSWETVVEDYERLFASLVDGSQ